jgi:thymidylate synthase
MSLGFPLLTTKKLPFKVIATELMWFLRGDTNIKFLVDNGCNIWTGDAYKKYTDHFAGYEDVPTQEEFIHEIKTDDEFAKKWGDLGPIYGSQWRRWTTWTSKDLEDIDQITNLINELKSNPNSRRLMVNAWNVGELENMTLPPCHYGFQVYTSDIPYEELHEELKEIKAKKKISIENHQFEKAAAERDIERKLQEKYPTKRISLMWNQRSVDTFLGLPFNIASYALLLMMIADEVNMVPYELIGNLGDTHLYSNHIEQAKEQLTREPMKLPTVRVQDGIFCSSYEDITLTDYNPHPHIKAPLSN